MKNEPENPPAFPRVRSTNLGGQTEYIHTSNAIIDSYGGMTLRDYFAAKAMAAEYTMWHHPRADLAYDDGKIAERSYRIADAMLAARQKEGK